MRRDYSRFSQTDAEFYKDHIWEAIIVTQLDEPHKSLTELCQEVGIKPIWIMAWARYDPEWKSLLEEMDEKIAIPAFTLIPS